MAIEYIRDGNGQIIGQQRGNLIQRNGKNVARFDEGINRTRKMDATITGFGDQRLRALEQEIEDENAS